MSEPERVLSTLTRAQGANQLLIDGTIEPAGFSLTFADVPVLVQGFGRMVRTLEFDVSEMALTTYLTAREHGVAFTALPIFLVRGFHHGAILYNTRSGIRTPADLEGRRVGVNRGYTVTTGVWARGILSTEYGVDTNRVTWVLSGREHVDTYVYPANVEPAGPGTDLAEMLITGEIDAVIGVDVDHPDVAPLISNPEEAALAALSQRRFYPINHLIVVKDELLQQYPSVGAGVVRRLHRGQGALRRPAARRRSVLGVRPAVHPGHAGHRRRPAAVRRGAQSGDARTTHRLRARPAHPDRARSRSTACSPRSPPAQAEALGADGLRDDQFLQCDRPVRRGRSRDRRTLRERLANCHVVAGGVHGVDRQQRAVAVVQNREGLAVDVATHDVVDRVRRQARRSEA